MRLEPTSTRITAMAIQKIGPRKNRFTFTA
jgi:hypothetical protein